MRRNASLSLPEHEVTDEWVYLARRRVLGSLALAPALLLPACRAQPPEPVVDMASIAPALLRSGFSTTETLTLQRDATTYNNFYEFGTGKTDPSKYAAAMPTKPWTITVEGECEHPGTLDLADLLKPHRVQERIYRMRCVEGWSMVLPWMGVPLAEALQRFAPTSKAKFVSFETLANPRVMRGMAYRSIDWPYREGLRIDEAMHPLTILATGLYGRDLPNQNGAPIRLVVPWKYGYKSIKSIVAIRFTERRPRTAWNDMQPGEYGFFSNVNPQVDHPRWSQKTERRIAGSDGKLFATRIETQMFNGYAAQVAPLYAGLDLRKWH